MLSDLKKVAFPVFPIRGHRRIFTKDGLVLIETEYAVYLLDVLNKLEEFAIRRVKYETEYPPYRFGKACMSFADLAVKTRAKIFIDSNGYIFTIQKTKLRKVTWYKLDYPKLVDSVGLLYTIKPIKFNFVTKRRYEYAAVADLGYDYLVVDLTDEPDFNMKRIKI